MQVWYLVIWRALINAYVWPLEYLWAVASLGPGFGRSILKLGEAPPRDSKERKEFEDQDYRRSMTIPSL